MKVHFLLGVPMGLSWCPRPRTALGPSFPVLLVLAGLAEVGPQTGDARTNTDPKQQASSAAGSLAFLLGLKGTRPPGTDLVSSRRLLPSLGQ